MTQLHSDNTTSKKALDLCLRQFMRKPSPEMRQAVELIVAEIRKRLLSPNEPPRPPPGVINKHLVKIEQALPAVIESLLQLDSLLKPHPSEHHGIFRGQFGLLNGDGAVRRDAGPIQPGRYYRDLSLPDADQGISIEQLQRLVEHAAWQRAHVSLDAARPDPSADRLCAVAVVDLVEMTQWTRPRPNDVRVWKLCEGLRLLSGGNASPGVPGDDRARWERHLRWALDGDNRPVQRLEAERIVSAAFKEAGFIALVSPEDAFC